MWNIAADYSKVDPAATREWLAQFKNAEYGVGMGLTEVLQSAKQQDPEASLKILRALTEAEALEQAAPHVAGIEEVVTLFS